ncbi:MAG: hypothetical protein AAFU85_33125, partial [Planctomycetota bacterium]
LEPQPILFLRGRRPGASETASNGEVLFASPSSNEGNDGRSIQTVGDRFIGVYLRRPYDMIGFDGLLAYRSESPNPGQPSDLFLTTGIMEPGARNDSLNPFIRPTRPDNASDILIEEDGFTLTQPQFTRAANPSGAAQFAQWQSLGLLERDVMYFFADGTGGRALNRMQVDEIRDNGMRSSGIAERRNYGLVYERFEVASSLNNPRSLVRIGDDLFFVADDPTFGSEIYRVNKNMTNATPERVTNVNQEGDSDPLELTVIDETLYFAAVSADGGPRNLFKLHAGDYTVQQVTATIDTPSQLQAVGANLVFFEDSKLWSTDGEITVPLAGSGAIDRQLSIGVIDEVGDGSIDGDQSKPLSSSTNVSFATGFSALQVDLTSEIQDAITAGYETLTLRLEAPLDSKEILIRASSDPTRSNPALQIRPSGLVGDLISETGHLVRSGNRAVTDLRDVDAGTYYVRVRRPDGDLSTEPIEYSLIVDAPTLGASHPTPDRDRIFGGDGDDRLVGAAELDALFGGSGRDDFGGESIEVFDLDEDAGESITLPASGFSNEGVPATDMQVLIGSDIDPNFRAGIARAIGHPVTVGFDGNAVTHRPIFASDIAELRRLNLSGLGIADLTGLEHASGLTYLDLSDNQLTRLDLPVEFRSLQNLDVSGNQIASLTPADLINAPGLERLFAEDNRVRNLSQLAGVSIIDNRDTGYSETDGQWQSEVFEAGAAWQNDYRIAKEGGNVTYTFDITIGETVEVFATWPT